MKKKIQYEESSGNVFADLDRPNPEELLAKSEELAEGEEKEKVCD